MHPMRVRLLVAMGLGSVAACPRTQGPSVAGTAASTTPSSAPSPPASTTAAVGDAGNDASDGAVEAAADAVAEAGTATDAKPTQPPKPKTKTLLGQADVWTVTYPVTVPGKPYCNKWWATCAPLAQALAVGAAPKPGMCPASVPMPCPHKGGMGGDEITPASICDEALQPAVTSGQRAAGKKDACCYASPPDCTPPWAGRVLAGQSGPVHAPVARRGGWLDVGLAEEVDGAALCGDRARAARHYTAMALGEHAAVASFAATSLALLAHGAPADLVAATCAAALDEIEHAKIAFALARAFGGEGLGPGPLDAPSAAGLTRVELAVSTLKDACIPETIGALIAREAAAAVDEPSLRRALDRIADDEARHAELAFRTLAFLVRAEDAEVRREVAQAVRAAFAAATLPSQPAAAGRPGVEHLGVPSPDRERAIAAQGWSDVVVPCVAALLEEV